MANDNLGVDIANFLLQSKRINLETRRADIAEQELTENIRLSKARVGVLDLESEFSTARNTQLKKDLAGTDDVRRDAAIDLLYGGSITRSMKQQLGVAQQQIQQMTMGMKLNAEMRAQQDQIKKGIKNQVDTIYGLTDLPADMKITLGSEMDASLTAMTTGQFNVETMRTPGDINIDIMQGVQQERDRLLKETEAKEKRAEIAKTGEIRERAGVADWPGATDSETKRTKYEYGSFLELDAAFTAKRDLPETRYVYIDPKGWGVRAKKDPVSGITIPSGEWQKGGMKLMTERRALALGVHDAWIKADPLAWPKADEVEDTIPNKVNLNDTNL